MGIVASDWIWWRGWPDTIFTYEVNMPPADVSAETWVYGRDGYTGIVSYRRRLPSGADEVVHPGGQGVPPWNWPPVINDFVSSITFGSANEVHLVARIDQWR